jgi:hypothetical protein
MHISRRDNLFRAAAILTACIYWFDPLILLFVKCFFTDMELACDAKAIKHLNGKQTGEYAFAVLKYASCKAFFATAFGGAKTKVRIENILSYKKLTLLSSVCFITLALSLAAAVITNAAVQEVIILKRSFLPILPFIILLSGCMGPVGKYNIKADNVVINYSFSSYAMFGADQSVIDELLDQFNAVKFTKTTDKLDIASAFNVGFSYNGKKVVSFWVDRDGVFWLDGETQGWKISSGSFNYDRLEEIYENSKNIPAKTVLPVISIARKYDIDERDLSDGMISSDVFIELTGAAPVSGSVYELTPPQLWENQKMQLFACGDIYDEAMMPYCVYFVKDVRIGLLGNTDGLAGSGLMGYAVTQICLADLDMDGVYEIYANSVIGSGISNSYIQAYDAPESIDKTVVYKPTMVGGVFGYEDGLDIKLKRKYWTVNLLV